MDRHPSTHAPAHPGSPGAVPMSCESFAYWLPDYLDAIELPSEGDGGMRPADLTALEQHRTTCASCASLVDGMESIRNEAAGLPILHPSRDLWEGIARRIDGAAGSVQLAAARPRVAPGSPAASGIGATIHGRRWLAAAAAMLVVSSASLGYLYARGGSGGLTATSVVATAPAPTPTEDPTTAGTGPARTLPVATVTGTASGSDAGAVAPSTTPTTARLAASVPTRRTAPDVAGAYARELGLLRSELDGRRSTLDTATVRILESNLAIIDRAIRESRTALENDPSSGLLNRQLSDAMGEKLELLRTAILLTSGA